jgi:hypothetical protein
MSGLDLFLLLPFPVAGSGRTGAEQFFRHAGQISIWHDIIKFMPQ